MAILEVSHIEKHFGRTNVLKDVRFGYMRWYQKSNRP